MIIFCLDEFKNQFEKLIRNNSYSSIEIDIIEYFFNKNIQELFSRYRLIEQKKFQLRIGVHPAFTLVKRQIVENGTSSEITEMLRFAAGELISTYQITPKWSVSAMFLHGSGLQLHGPQNTDVLFLSTNFGDIPLGKDIRFRFIPMIFFLRMDRFTGNYFSATGILSHKKSPFSLQSTVNQTFTSNIPNNKNFIWNIMFAYNFKKIYQIMR